MQWRIEKKGSVCVLGKPGIMLYFELRPCIEQLTRAQKGELLDAFMEYGEFSRVPELSKKVQLIWPLIQLKLDRDTERYEKTVMQKAYAGYVRQNPQPMSFEQWKQQRLLAAASECSSPLNSADQTTNHKLQTTDHKLQTANSKPVDAEPSATHPVFSPPGKADVLSYCKEMGFSMDADSFVDYYSANGWNIGKSPMRDWKAAVRRWNRKENPNGNAEENAIWNVGTVV
jgi:hypothetical protein